MPLSLRRAPDPALRVQCADIRSFDASLGLMAQQMLDLMYRENGRGLAAPQAGLTLRLFVMDWGWKEGAPTPQVFLNPVVLWAADEMQSMVEGCLSLPGEPRRIARPNRVRLGWQALDGRSQQAEFAGIEAVIVQHERDHLDGILITDLPEAVEDAPP